MDIEHILRDTSTVAIVGASANVARASHEVWTYLRSHSDFTLYLVNPTIGKIEGTPVYPSLADLPVVPDLVDVSAATSSCRLCSTTPSRSGRKPCGCNQVCGMSRSPATEKQQACRWSWIAA
jgi:hypothetical protein